jgi:hypothetical protein
MDPKVALALRGELPLGELSRQQQEDYFDYLDQILLLPSLAEHRFFADRRRRGVGVGLDDEGRLIYQSPER